MSTNKINGSQAASFADSTKLTHEVLEIKKKAIRTLNQDGLLDITSDCLLFIFEKDTVKNILSKTKLTNTLFQRVR